MKITLIVSAEELMKSFHLKANFLENALRILFSILMLTSSFAMAQQKRVVCSGSTEHCDYRVYTNQDIKSLPAEAFDPDFWAKHMEGNIPQLEERYFGESGNFDGRINITVNLGHDVPGQPGYIPAQGVTSYNRHNPDYFEMEADGSLERVLDSVLPHETSHVVLAEDFGGPLPRWCDEGLCTTVEHESERKKHEENLRKYLRSRRGYPMNRLMLMTEYPDDVLPMYAQGYSVTKFLIEQGGTQKFVSFIKEQKKNGSWTDSVRSYYGYDTLSDLQNSWLGWVGQGCQPLPAAKPSVTQPRVGSRPTILNTFE